MASETKWRSPKSNRPEIVESEQASSRLQVNGEVDQEQPPKPSQSVEEKADFCKVVEASQGAPEVLRRSSTSGRDKKKYRMREHWFCKHVLAPLYAIPRVRLRKVLEYWILKLENKEWFSVTMRKLYKRHYDLEIGDYTGGPFDVGTMKRGTTVGRYCSLFPSLRIETANHPTNTISSNGIFYNPASPFENPYLIPRNKLEIGHDVWIGHNATILFPTKKIGHGAVIAASAVVVEDVPPFAVVAGYPATIVRYRFSEKQRKEILESKWWNASLEELESVKKEFIKPLEGARVR